MKAYLIGVMKSYLIVALLLGMLVVLAANQDAAPEKWGRAGLWEIDVDRDAGNVCFTTRLYLMEWRCVSGSIRLKPVSIS